MLYLLVLAGLHCSPCFNLMTSFLAVDLCLSFLSERSPKCLLSLPGLQLVCSKPRMSLLSRPFHVSLPPSYPGTKFALASMQKYQCQMPESLVSGY